MGGPRHITTAGPSQYLLAQRNQRLREAMTLALRRLHLVFGEDATEARKIIEDALIDDSRVAR